VRRKVYPNDSTKTGNSVTSKSWVVLVVEDEILVRMAVVADLEDEGFTVFEAANADAAIVLLQAQPSINLLLTDVEMPGSMDGLKLAEAVRNRWPPVKIIVVSGHFKVSDGDLPEGGRFFAKPYLGSAIVTAFREMVA
jgi:CheY-like chemotaxis protein